MTAQNLAEAYATLPTTRRQLRCRGNAFLLLSDCPALTGAEAAGLLARGAHGGMELLSSTSHRAADLELYEHQHETGPCVEALQTGLIVTARSDDRDENWSELRTMMVAAGFRTVSAFPVLWHETRSERSTSNTPQTST